MTGLFPPSDQGALYLSRHDPAELLGTYSDHTLLLEDKVWPTAEHYFQAMQFESEADQERVRMAPTPMHARRIGEPGWLRSRLQHRRRDWTKVRVAFMTRAVWIKCNTFADVAERLLDTGECRIVENDQYDYFWGCGRDLRGENRYGRILMQVRSKLGSHSARTS